ncbi:hypothetical protein D0S45_07475 [Marinifilum sp. JC120]|nr:hypothetical protein D0S45_07475 [Marinifilum sp. JC120]
MKKKLKFNVLWLVSALVLALQGCATHMHNPANMELAGNSAKAMDEIIKETNIGVAAQKANQKALLESEIAAMDNYIRLDIEAEIEDVVASKGAFKSKVIKVVTERLDEIGVVGIESGKMDIADLEGIENKLSKIEVVASVYRRFQGKLKTAQQDLKKTEYDAKLGSCSLESVFEPLDEDKVTVILNKITDPKERQDKDDTIRSYYKVLTDLCHDFREKSKSGLFKAGKMIEIQNEIHWGEDKLAGAKVEAEEIAKKFTESQKMLKKALKSKNEKLNAEIANKMKEARELVSVSSDIAKVIGDLALVENALDTLDIVLAHVETLYNPMKKEGQTGEEAKQEPEVTDPEKVRMAYYGMILVQFADLAKELHKLDELRNRPPMTALIMVRNELAARRDVLKARLKFQQNIIALLKGKKDSLSSELKQYLWVIAYYVEAHKTYAEYTKLIKKAEDNIKVSAFETLSYSDLVRKKVDVSKKNEVYDEASRLLMQSRKAIQLAFVRYLYGLYLAGTSSFHHEYKAISLDYAASLDEANARIAQWIAMLGPLIDQQKEYHSGGIKSEEITELAMQALIAGGVIGIAVK